MQKLVRLMTSLMRSMIQLFSLDKDVDINVSTRELFIIETCWPGLSPSYSTGLLNRCINGWGRCLPCLGSRDWSQEVKISTFRSRSPRIAFESPVLELLFQHEVWMSFFWCFLGLRGRCYLFGKASNPLDTLTLITITNISFIVINNFFCYEHYAQAWKVWHNPAL